MNSVTIGVYLDDDQRRLEPTLAGLAAHTEAGFELVLLPDADEAAGAAAWFNRLAAGTNSDVVIFLEAGVVPGPRWLEILLAALYADPANGLAGPSTNSTWNEQCSMRGGGGTLSEVAATSRSAAQRFGTVWKGLEPLHSLSDFCYAVKREVIAAVGGADEQYGLAPCWEMDYNIRAARRGWRGVWACGAYIYRPPFSARRAREEPRLMEYGKRRYQDKFCGRRLRQESFAYELHCRGEECEHFGPRDRIQIQLPLATSAVKPVPAAGLLPPQAPGSALVSCVMVTGRRREFALQSIRYFERQDYANRELVIIDDGPEDLTSEVAHSLRVRYVRVPSGLTIGDKRNRGCELSRGAIIAQWDDDDWYGPGRLRAQVQPILAGEADLSGLTGSVFFDLPRWQFWTCSMALHRRMFVEDVHGGTLVYRREIWEKNRYPNASLAEDAALLRGAVGRGGRLRRLPGTGLFLYLRHGGNTWSFECGKYLDPAGWTAIEPPDLGEDLNFYAARSGSAPHHAWQPLVSCIMPTANRRAFVKHAIRCFQRQTYGNRELLILDDGLDCVEDLVPQDPAIKYVRMKGPQSLGAKRNQACEMARGDVIAHWDDDDWVADWRLDYQVSALAARPNPSACGLSSVYFCHRSGDRAWLYVDPAGARPWIAGGTMCYHKALWRQYRFQEINEGEDTRFVWALPAGTIVPLPDNRFYVATVHEANTSAKRTSDSRWHARPLGEVQSLVGECWRTLFGASAVGAGSEGCGG